MGQQRRFIWTEVDYEDVAPEVTDWKAEPGGELVWALVSLLTETPRAVALFQAALRDLGLLGVEGGQA